MSTLQNYIQSFDSDEEINYEVDNAEDDEIKLSVQERVNPVLNELNLFLKEPAFINPIGDASSRLINLATRIPYNIPDIRINKFFKYIEHIRRKRLSGIMWMERQYFHENDYSGIMIDLDIYQETAQSQFIDFAYNLLAQHLARVLKQYLNIEEHKQADGTIKIQAIILRRQRITRKSDEEPFKDGIHVLLPGIKVKKEVKKLLIDKFANKDSDFFKYIKVVNKKYEQSSVHENLSYKIVDKMSTTVPVFLYGCVREQTRDPYVLEKIIEIQFSTIMDTINGLESLRMSDPAIQFVTGNYGFFDEDIEIKTGLPMPTSNWSQEFSLHWEVPKNPIIKKYKFELKEEYNRELEKYIVKADNSTNDIYGDLDIRRINDPEIDFVQKLLDTLNPNRAEHYGPWFDVLCVLAHAKGDMKPLAIYFSQKCASKFNMAEFEIHWAKVKKNKNNCLNLGSLCLWAKQDNPERYKEVCNRRIFTIILKKIYDGTTEGIMGHYDIAEILNKCLPYKYTYSREIGGIWYEFITEDDDQKHGEVFKWKVIPGQPSTMRNYISVVLPNLFQQILRKIKDNYEKAGKEEAQYHYIIKKNFQQSCRKLKDATYKYNVVKDAQDIYNSVTFVDKIDKYPNILPVANGILILGPKVRLIQGYHNYLVSKFAPVDYIPFDPRHPMIKKVLYIYRNLFPDDEPDTHEFFMCAYASSLDSGKKESLFFMKVGGGKNGKTMTTEIHRNTLGFIFAVTLPIQYITTGPKRDAEASSPATMKTEHARTIDFQESDRCETLSASKMKLITGQGAVGGRENFGEYRTFKLTCNYFTDTNNELIINDNTYGTWRRIKFIRMIMKFFHPHELDNYDPKNPLHRLAIDIDTEDPEFLSAYLAVMVYYYEKLQRLYDGKVTKVPHPHIERATQEYQNRQDKLSKFLDATLIKCADDEKDVELSLEELIGKYERWFKNFGVVDRDFKKGIENDFQNSKIADYLEKDARGIRFFLKGYRVYEQNGVDDLKDGEEWFSSISKKNKNNKLKTKSETVDEYYQNICREYDEDQKRQAEDQKRQAEDQKKECKDEEQLFTKTSCVQNQTYIDKMIANAPSGLVPDIDTIISKSELSKQAKGAIFRINERLDNTGKDKSAEKSAEESAEESTEESTDESETDSEGNED